MYYVAVVDDETGQAEVLAKLLEQMASDFKTIPFSRSSDVLRYLESHPLDAVITDIRMPVMDGLELARQVHSRSPYIVICIISAYSDFEYAQSAIEIGVTSYLIKPVGVDKLLDITRRITEQLRQRDSYRSMYLEHESARQLIDERQLFDWLERKGEEGFEPPDILARKPSGYLALFRMNGEPNAQTIIRGKMTELFEGREIFFATSARDDCILACLAPRGKDDREQTLVRCVNSWAQGLNGRELFRAALTILSSGEDWSMCFRRVCKLLDSAFLFPKPPCMTARYLSDCVPFPEHVFYDLEQSLLYALREQRAEDMQRLLSAFQESCVQQRWLASAIAIKEHMIHLVMSVHHFLDVADSSQICAQITEAESMGEACGLLTKRLTGLAKQHQQRLCDTTEGLIQRVVNYVLDHCCEELTLELIAVHFHLSSAYLSSMFKQYAKKGFKEYLIDARIEKAKHMLIHSDDKVYEISAKIGYTDTAYFVKLFKRKVGVSPNKYRGLEHHQ